MHYKSWNIKFLSFGVILIIVATLLSSCSGGTRGTGGNEFDARLLDDQGKAVSGVTVTIVETGDSAVTDAEGRFIIESEVTGTANFLFEGENFSVTTSVTDIPTSGAVVNVEFKINKNRNKVEPTEVELEDRDEADDHSGGDHGGGDSSSPDDGDSVDDDSGSGDHGGGSSGKPGGGGSKPSNPGSGGGNGGNGGNRPDDGSIDDGSDHSDDDSTDDDGEGSDDLTDDDDSHGGGQDKDRQ